MIDAYRSCQQHQALSTPRVDLILGVYDETLKKLQRAAAFLVEEPKEAHRLLRQCEVAVAGLAASIDPDAGEVAANLRRLYQFVGHCLADGSPAKLRSAVDILTTLRDGFEAIRTQAIELERKGEIPSLDDEMAMRALA